MNLRRLGAVARKESLHLVRDWRSLTLALAIPLLLILLERGRILLTVLHKSNYKAFNTYAPKSYPCLADPSLPPLVESMADTLDWLFGEGFARELSWLRL